MIAKLVLDRKREGEVLGRAEIREFIEGFTRGAIPDYQMSALAMAICCRGMDDRETADLTEAMMKSGACLEWSGVTADKHSTGGVGDKLSLVVQPLAAACGLSVPSLTGRGLGITGGTADKLETIPGYSCSLSLSRFREVVAETGVSMTVQTDEIAPADRKLYALRDVTGTVASIPLIVASILSKKLAEGAGTLVFDVKAGRGAFMKTVDEAKILASALVNGARAAGRRAAALVTAMDAPLGRAVGNANEVREAIALLKGAAAQDSALKGEEELCVELAALMVSLGLGKPLAEARGLCRARLADGSAWIRFAAMVKAHGGDLEAFDRLQTEPVRKFCLRSPRPGFVIAVDAEKVARVALRLGAGREKAGDAIDPLAGVTLAAVAGDRVAAGAPLATLEKSFDAEGLEQAAAELELAFSIGSEPPSPSPLVIARLDGTMPGRG